MTRSVHGRLSLMMLLQYAVWGFWLPVLARYLQAAPAEGGLGFTPGQVGWILGLAGSIGAVTAPFVAGQFADRYFSTERFLAVLLLLGGVVKIVTAYQTSFAAWLLLSILYSVIYTPTLALTNSLAFAHLDDPDRQFPFVRVWGTIGWIVASWLFPLVWLLTDVRFQALPPFYTGQEVADATHRLADSLIFSGVTSIGYAAFALFLPHTPPRREATEKLAFAKAFRLFRHRSFAVLVAASLPIAVIHQIYFMQTAPFFSDVLGLKDSQIGPAMTIGQFAEIAVMAGVGLLLARLGARWVITLGAFAYFLRYAIFADGRACRWASSSRARRSTASATPASSRSPTSTSTGWPSRTCATRRRPCSASSSWASVRCWPRPSSGCWRTCSPPPTDRSTTRRCGGRCRRSVCSPRSAFAALFRDETAGARDAGAVGELRREAVGR